MAPIRSLLIFALCVSAAGTATAQELSPPRPHAVDHAVARQKALAQQIDAALAEAWAQQKVEVAEPADDATWLRRLDLDLLGTIPTREEVADFLADRRADKRDAKIDACLVDPGFAENLSDLWTDLLLAAAARAPLRLRLRPWLESVLANELPFAEITRRLIAGAGRNDDNAATSFVLAYADDVEALSGVAARTFLGVQLQCAQCHDHPYDHWKQSDFDGFTAFFATTRAQRVGSADPPVYELADTLEDPKRAARLEELADRMRPEMRAKVMRAHDRAEKYRSARYLDGRPFMDSTLRSRRQALAEWIIDPDNPWFARSVANRMWGHLFGKGLTEPVDDLTGSQDAILPALLGTLGRAFSDSDTDLRFLVGTLVRTRAYGLAPSRQKEGEARTLSERWFAAHPLRPFTPAQVLHALLRATAIDQHDLARERGQEFEVARNALLEKFRYVFSDDEGGSGESFTSGIPQALYVMNGPLTNEAIRLQKSRMLDAILDETHSNLTRLLQIFLATLGRPPTEREAERLTPLMRNANGGRARGIEDLYWALLNSTEFLTNH